MNGRNSTWFRLDSIPQRSLAVGVAALAVCFAGALFDTEQFFRSYLVAYLFAISFSLGCLALVMLHHLVGGAWGFVIQRLLESGIKTLPLMAVLFLPLIFGIHHLYPWAWPEAVAADPILQRKTVYLNVPFFVLRTVLYFAIWIILSHFLNKWSLEQDRTAEASLTRRLQNLSGPGLILYGLTVTFSSIDWMMSLEPHWYSTIYGMMFMASHGLAALALVICVAYTMARSDPLARVIGPDHFHDLGNLLLALVMFWAYLGFSQFMLVWMENIKEETPWYYRRTSGGWQIVAVLLILGQFALPFLLLLSRAAKRRPRILSGVAFAILFMHWVDLLWLVAPAFQPRGFYIHWLDIGALIGIGGIWMAAFLHRLGENPLLPLNDPRFTETLQQAQRAQRWANPA
jgi:hypothetical protein